MRQQCVVSVVGMGRRPKNAAIKDALTLPRREEGKTQKMQHVGCTHQTVIGGEESVLDMDQRLFVKIAVLRGAESARPSKERRRKLLLIYFPKLVCSQKNSKASI